MSNDAEWNAPDQKTHRIAIWGSCVSRDTIEFMPDVEVRAYVARQSAIVALGPATDVPVPLENLDSDFQRRMIAGDLNADAQVRVTATASATVLIDLVDERHGVWKFPDGSFLTNSVEAYKTGVDRWAPVEGARLIRFGTDEHFELWKKGYAELADGISSAGQTVVLLDIAWAEVFEGQAPPRGLVSELNRVRRSGARMLTSLYRTMRREQSVEAGISAMIGAPRSPGDAHVKIARDANREYRRYVDFAREYADSVIRLTPDQVRMSRDHRWGVGPYHYSDGNYEMIRDELYRILA